MPKRQGSLELQLAAEAKSIVALAFRKGRIEGCSRGKRVPHLRWEIRILAHNAS